MCEGGGVGWIAEGVCGAWWGGAGSWGVSLSESEEAEGPARGGCLHVHVLAETKSRHEDKDGAMVQYKIPGRLAALKHAAKPVQYSCMLLLPLLSLLESL